MRQKLNYIKLLLAVIFISGCETPEPASLAVAQTTPPAEIQSETLACYLNKCFTPVSISSIKDNKHDYAYPDENDFPTHDKQQQYRPPFAILDLLAINPTERLSDNFSVSEFMARQKGRYGLLSSYVLTQMQLMRNALNQAINITSGYRSPGYNRGISGSAKWSRHTYGDAVDFYAGRVNLRNLLALCQQYSASFTLIYNTHIHCDWRDHQLDPAFYQGLEDTPITRDGPSLSAMQQLQAESYIRLKKTDSELEFYVSSEMLEHEVEEGQPIYEWTVYLNNVFYTNSNVPNLKLPKQSGSYSVQVEVGGAIRLENRFVVP